MRRLIELLPILFLTIYAGVAWGSDACSTRAIVTAAEVTDSDGLTFKTQSFFHSKDAAAIRHIRDTDQVVAVEGPLSWAVVGDRSQAGEDFFKVFALGHQYHAFLLHFDELVTDPRETERVTFQGSAQSARSGGYPYGGMVHLVESTDPQRPAGLLFEFPESEAIQVSFSDWRKHGSTELPYRAEIDDGQRVFDYRYSSVETAPQSPLWFYEKVGEPALDQVHVYRLHRRMLAAHCLGDADMLSTLSAAEILSANRGELQQIPNESMRDRFAALFERLDYSEYHDIAMPVIQIAESSDLGWIGVNVRARGSDKISGEPFDNQWAWLMTVRKIDGRWLHTGNASNAVH